MAELESEASSSVNHLPQDTPSLSIIGGSGISEVNKDELISVDYQPEENIIVPAPVNNLKINNGAPLNKIDEDLCLVEANENHQHADGTNCNATDTVIDNKSEASAKEVKENIKNELMTQQHCPLSNPEAEEVTNDSPEQCNVEIAMKSSSIENKGAKKKREVRFPDDSSINRCCDPPDPWKNAPLWTTDELITAYKKSCTINGCKPVIKVLQQLHSITTPGKRKDSFVLKGEKLDQKQVECIEEILRRVQFQLIDLEATHLDDECAVALFDMIEHYESACQLNVSFNRNIGPRGWQACSRLVRRTPTLNFLDIRNCDLNDRTIPIFGRALKMGCHLTVLHMEGMCLTARPLIILVAALKMNDHLQELFLAENKLVPTDGAQLGNLLHNNHRLNLLDLRNNNLQDVGVSHVCDGLVEQKSGRGLRTLVLWNNQISYQAMHALGRALAISTSLETLNIGHNGITNEGVHLVKDGLLKTTSLLRVGLQGTRISDEGAVALAEYIADSTILLRMDLRDNDIKTGGLMALSHAMRVNNSVTRIDLDKETKKESGMKDYAEVQIRLLRDILTFQERNVQLVMEREEAERAKLERRAIEAAAAREMEKMEKEVGESPLAAVTSNIESFTIIEADQVETLAENEDISGEETNDSSSGSKEPVISSLPSVSHSEEEEQMPAHQRPSVLFARMGLQPQESLDSPRTPSDQSDAFKSSSDVSTSPQAPPHPPSLSLSTPEKSQLNAGTPPVEMLLSPQFCSKQLARKIFSVSRVSEDICSSPSADDEQQYDPLNVSLMDEVPVLDSQPPSAAVSSSTQVPTIISSSAPVSPASLFEDLANETVKHIVSSEEPDTSIMASNTCLSYSAESESKSTMDLPPDPHLLVNCDSKERCDNNDHSDTRTASSLPSTQEVAMPNVEVSTDNPDPISISRESANIEISSVKMNPVNENEAKACDKSGNSETVDSSGVVEAVSEFDNDNQTLLQTEQVQSPSDEVVNPSINSDVLPSVPSSTPANVHAAGKEISASCSNSLPLANTSLSSSHSLHETPSCNRNNVEEETKRVFPGEKDMVKLELDGIDVSLEEEPWTSLEKDESCLAAPQFDISGEEKQPDFFTTLSMNVLTQELASALTSLDGSSQDFEDSQDSHNQDDFERELDAMVAEVQKKSPKVVKD